MVALQAQPDHRPERAHAARAARIQPLPPADEIPAVLALRPFWLLPDPRPLGIPSRHGTRLEWLAGAEVLEGGWWDQRPIARHYYRVRLPAGVLAWIYEDRLQPNRWYLQGLFG
jgi:protein ImuB